MEHGNSIAVLIKTRMVVRVVTQCFITAIKHLLEFHGISLRHFPDTYSATPTTSHTGDGSITKTTIPFGDKIMYKSASITNVENDGVISKSGSDVYYNYMVYLNSLAYAEQFVCRELNRAISLNFPEQYAAGIRLGLRIEVPARQQEITPSKRLEQQQPV